MVVVAVGVLVVVGVCVVVGVRVRVRETRASAQPATHTGRSEDMQDLPTTPHRLDHENLDVYRCAIKFLSFAFELANSLPRGEGELRDQLNRAAISVVLNIAAVAFSFICCVNQKRRGRFGDPGASLCAGGRPRVVVYVPAERLLSLI